jgi:membrane-bound lytic murein transglycosylase D
MGNRLVYTYAVAVMLFVAIPASSNPQLPKPAGLAPAVAFWERIYSEVETNGGLIHDSEYLDVVYEKMIHPPGLSSRAKERRQEKRKREIKNALTALAKGKRTGLSSDEAAILAKWPTGVTNASLKRGTRNVRFQLGQANKFRAGLERSGAWRAYIDQTMVERGVPVELGALPHVESSFNPKAYSRVGAAGLWQFTRSTGRLFMRIDSVVDERLDPWIATRSAAKLLKKNYELTKTWPLAITSYNHGAAGMNRAAKKLGTRDIATIVRKYNGRTFGFASRNFYASFLAAVAVDGAAEQHFGTIRYQQPVRYATIEMPHYYKATSLASAFGVGIDVLKEHNNSLRPAVWQGSKYVPEGFSLRLPADQVATEPATLLAKVPESQRLAKQHRDRYHKVRRGETLSKIAKRYGTRESTLVRLNNLRSRHRIRVGQVIVLPGSVAPPVAVARKDPPKSGIYKVRRGDTLSIIGRRFGVSENALVRENGLRSRHRIQVGQRLRIPGAGVQIASTAATPPPKPAEPAPTPTPEPVVVAEPVAPVVVAKSEPEPVAEPATPAPVVAKTEPVAVATPEPAPIADAEPEPLPMPVAVAEPTPVVPDPAPVVEPSPVVPDPAPVAEPTPVQVAVTKRQPAAAPAPSERLAPSSVAPRGQVPDPSDYEVHDGRVTVQAAETLGHYADWLEVRASQLRAKNRMRYGRALVIGRSVRLDFSRVTEEEFERRRLEYHRTLQAEYFDAFSVTGTETHVLKRGDTLWVLAERKYRVPIWLLRQYNPEIDFGSLPAGAEITVPVVEPREGTS